MRAAVLRRIGEPLEVRADLELGGPGPGEVRVRLAARGVCHTDLSVRDGPICGAAEIVAVDPVDQKLDVNDAFAAMQAGEVIRTLIEF